MWRPVHETLGALNSCARSRSCKDISSFALSSTHSSSPYGKVASKSGSSSSTDAGPGATMTVHPLSITPSSLVLGATVTVHPAPAPTLLLSLRLSRSVRKGCSPCSSKFLCLSNQVGSELSWHIPNLSCCQVCILFLSATGYREFVNARRTKKGPS